MIARLAESKSILDLCLSAVQEVQRLTSFDRVMVYRFHEDLHGEVIAEAVRPGVESYLGLHYPASDIPAPARAVFQRNWLRMIPDVKYESSPVVPAFDPVSGAPLDLSKSVLRSVSPLHLEYLGNMVVEIQTITWAGNPEKGEERPGTEQRIRPRKSFEAWKQLVKLRSAPWKPLGDRGCDGAEELDSGPWIWSDNSVRCRGRAREELMSVLSHDLKNPLSSIDLNLALISRLCVPELLKPVRSPFERIVRSVQIMRLPIEDILEITRIETGNVSLNRMEVDASEVVEEAGEMLASIDEEKNLEMVMLKMPEDCITRRDRGRTSQAGLVEVPDFRHGARDSQGEIWAQSEPGSRSAFQFPARCSHQ